MLDYLSQNPSSPMQAPSGQGGGGAARRLVRDAALDEKLHRDLETKTRSQEYQRMLKFRQELPAYKMKQQIIDVIESNQVVVISGETGSGKTTQVPQFILDSYIENGKGSTCRVVCTQPRRISAISVAERVAAERGERCGEASSGYQIRLECRMPRDYGSILFCTTGILLQQLEGDPYIQRASHVILDEVHERDLQTDFLSIILKDLLAVRPDLHVILMSATINAHPVFEVLWYSNRTLDTLAEWNELRIDLDLVHALIEHICATKPEGAILVFLPGWEQISEMNKRLKGDPSLRGSCLVIPLHSMMPTVNQRQVFDRPPPGQRKVVLATNIAETSITINDVVYVIDCGKIKMSNFDVENNLATLDAEWVSKANAQQRKGRAGRVQPGVCYRLYTSWRESQLDAYQLPEMLRTRLETLILKIKSAPI
ncbi:hypothetical protein HPB48_010961 [Haemaphysalis longicornis]|uniref:RNA helicase n=1 Tax=Haemaphysalis longicornis TaxID=44386 RepID=A0A9J6GQ62_HAELO|nr:hypothetical protein HPB48_010961 [Haemaphysalis longicornis]